MPQDESTPTVRLPAEGWEHAQRKVRQLAVTIEQLKILHDELEHTVENMENGQGAS
jgi:hypothetical protein